MSSASPASGPAVGPSASQGAGQRAVVIGAGLAGLSAAWRLRSRGFEVVVLEQRGVVGGRATGDVIDGFAFDAALPVISPRDAQLMRFIHELGATERMLPLRPVQLAQAYDGRASAIDTGSVLGLSRIPGMRPLDALRAFRLHRLMRRYRSCLDPAAPERAADLDFRSAADFARLYFGRSAFERWIAPAIESTTLGDANELSRVAFLLQFSELGEGREHWALPRAGLFELAQLAGERVEARCGVEVEQVEASGGGGFVVHCGPAPSQGGLTDDGPTSADDVAAGESIEAETVVIATGGSAAGRIAAGLLTPAERDFFAGVKSGLSAVLIAALEAPLAGLPQLVRVPQAEASPICTYLSEPGVPEGRVPLGRGLLTVSATQQFASTRANASDDVVEKELCSALSEQLPGAAGAMRMTRLERRDSAVPNFDVGTYRALARFDHVQRDRRSLGRRLYFAGDYFVGPRAQHAVVSGGRAAEAAIADLG